MKKNDKFPNAISYDPKPLSEARSRVSLAVSSVIMDRLAGASLVDNVWGNSINADFVVNRLQADSNMRDNVARYLLDGSMGKLFSNVIESRVFRVGGIQATKAEVFNVAKAISDSDTGTILTEFAIPLLMSNGLTSANVEYAVRRKIEYADVTVDIIAQDLLRQELTKAVEQAKDRFVLPTGQHSTSAVAEMFSDALRPVGIAMTMINNYEKVLHDIILGVLAQIDPAPLLSQKGSVPEDLRNHEVVLSLMSNWMFNAAAMNVQFDMSDKLTQLRC